MLAGVKVEEARPTWLISGLEKAQPLLSTWIEYVMLSFAPAGSVESLQSKVGVASLVRALLAGVRRFGVVGATLPTVTVWLAMLPAIESESVNWVRTIGLAGPSGKVHWNVPVWLPLLPVVDREPPTKVPPVPQSGNPALMA